MSGHATGPGQIANLGIVVNGAGTDPGSSANQNSTSGIGYEPGFFTIYDAEGNEVSGKCAFSFPSLPRGEGSNMLDVSRLDVLTEAERHLGKSSAFLKNFIVLMLRTVLKLVSPVCF